MQFLGRAFALFFIFLVASVAWVILGGVMDARTREQEAVLHGQVADLWGAPQRQPAPALVHQWTVTRPEVEERDEGGKKVKVERLVAVPQEAAVSLAGSEIAVKLGLDQRRKGLLWFALYDVSFRGDYRYVHQEPTAGWLAITVPFPSEGGMYDAFTFTVDGVSPPGLEPTAGGVVHTVPVQPGQELRFSVGYTSRGLREWTYAPVNGTGALRDFHLRMETDFADIDFPAMTMSPSEKVAEGDGWRLDWTFSHLVTSQGIGMVMPERIQPGPLAERLAFSAPISLGFFLVVLFVIALLKGVPLHPMHAVFLAASFFAFHLLFGYLCDRLSVELAFAVASVVSVVLVVSYLHRAISAGFAWGPVAAAQLVYLVGFGLAHFWEGNTGLTVTVLAVLTLFVLMQLTARVDWAKVLDGGARLGEREPPPAG